MRALVQRSGRVLRSDGHQITAAMPVITMTTAVATVLLAAWLGYDLAEYEGHCIVGTAMLVAAFVLRRIAGPTCRVCVMLEGAAFLYAFIVAVRFLIYLGQALAFPLCDDAFTLIDQKIIGLDFAAAMKWLDSQPVIAAALSKAYASFFWQNPMTAVLLPLLGKTREAERFVVGFMLTMLVVTVWSAVMPSIGPITTVDAGEFQSLRFPGAQHVDHVMALRSGAMQEISLVKTLGIISFPSFHAACALLCTWAWRSVPVVVLPLAILNTAMALSAIPEGAHYAVDVIFGLGIAAAVIGIVRSIVPDPATAAHAGERAPSSRVDAFWLRGVPLKTQ